MIKKNNILKKYYALILILLTTFSLIPYVSIAQTPNSTSTLDYSGWVQCDGVVDPSESGRQVPCNFVNLINMARYLINWLFMISIPIIIGLLAYAGILHMTGKVEDIKKSYSMLQKALIGLLVMLMAWFIVTTLLKWVLEPWAVDVASTLVEKQK